jgi:hypothetical protein
MSLDWLFFRSTWVHSLFIVGSRYSIFSSICMFGRSLFVLLSCFPLAIVLSVLLRYTDYDYPFDTFKFFWQNNLGDSISLKPCIVLNTTEHITYQTMKLSISFDIVISERVLYGGQQCRTRVNICYSFQSFPFSGIAKLLQSTVCFIAICIVFWDYKRYLQKQKTC